MADSHVHTTSGRTPKRIAATGRLALFAFVAVAFCLLSGCQQRVVGASGIGASQLYPTVSEPRPTDRLTDFVWGPREPAPIRGQY